MKTPHPTGEQLRTFGDGRLAGRALIETARHIAGCSKCAATASEGHDIDTAAAALRADLSATERRASPWWIAIAAGAGGALLMTGWLTMHRSIPNLPPQRRQIRATTSSTERVEWKVLVDTALIDQRIAPPEILRELRPSASSLRAVRRERRMNDALKPAGVVVDTDRPAFSWAAVEGAKTYRVLVFAHGEEVARSEPLSVTSWQPSKPLARGGIFEWQVIASTPHGDVVLPPPEAPRALIGVLSAAAAEEIAAARRERPGETLLLGLLYARAGVIDRAEEELRVYAAKNPRSTAANSLLRCVAEWR
jgi:hypothetical protein